MKRIVTPQEMQEIDRKTIESFGIPVETLMENAGRAVFECLIKAVPDFRQKTIFVLCGKGNNGGDGLVVARYLKEAGAVPIVYFMGSLQERKMDILIPFNKLVAVGIHPIFISPENFSAPEAPDIVVDALLGTGTRGNLDLFICQLIELVNHWKIKSHSMVVAVDNPSGLNVETGKPLNACICADLTVTIGLPKKGLIFGEGKNFTGKLEIVEIGFPNALVKPNDFVFIEADDVKELFKPRPFDAHKHQMGKVLVIAGSKTMTGAAFLTAKSALRIGAGLVKVATPECVAGAIQSSLPEAMTVGLPQTSSGALGLGAWDEMQKLIDWASVIAIGPGLSQSEETTELVRNICRALRKPAVIDADGIFALAGEFELISSMEADVILTPHAGEFAMLTGVQKEKLLNDKLSVVRSESKKLLKTILLKGAPTLIGAKSGKVYVSNTGNPGMATAGSGDVLTGIIAGLMAQGLSSEQAGYAGAFVHGLSGDLAKEDKTEMGLIAGDLIENLPRAIKLAIR